MIREPHVIDHLYELVAVLLAVLTQELGVGLPRDQIQGLRVSFHDTRHRLDRVLETLARPDEPEGGDDQPSVQPELGLHAAPALGLDMRHAVVDHGGLKRHAVYIGQDVDRRFRHHDHTVSRFGDAAYGTPHRRARLWKDRMQRHERGLSELLQEGCQVVLIRALDPRIAHEALALPEPVKAELVLDADDVGRRIVDRAGGCDVGIGVALADPPPDLVPVGPDHAALVDRRHPGLGVVAGLAYGPHQV